MAPVTIIQCTALEEANIRCLWEICPGILVFCLSVTLARFCTLLRMLRRPSAAQKCRSPGDLPGFEVISAGKAPGIHFRRPDPGLRRILRLSPVNPRCRADAIVPSLDRR
jgi:hypothetical protein